MVGASLDEVVKDSRAATSSATSHEALSAIVLSLSESLPTLATNNEPSSGVMDNRVG